MLIWRRGLAGKQQPIAGRNLSGRLAALAMHAETALKGGTAPLEPLPKSPGGFWHGVTPLAGPKGAGDTTSDGVWSVATSDLAYWHR